jgi:hypothetical protein
MSLPNTPSSSPPSTGVYDQNPDWTPDYTGYSPDNIILAGRNNTISDSRRCSILQGVSNTINGKYNTHIIGDYITATSDNSFYVGCINGLFSYGDVVAYAASDERLKNDIIPISGCLEKIESIDPIEFNWNENQQTYSGHDIGLIAQQIQEIAPEIVTQRSNGYLAVKYEKMVPILVGAIKEQQSLIQEMREEINELKEKIIR